MKRAFAIPLRFGAVGLLATSTHSCLALILLQLTHAPLLANLGGFSAAFLVGFAGHLQYSFSRRNLSWTRALVRYAVLSIASFLIAQTILFSMINATPLPDWIAVFCGVIFTAIFNFVLSSFWAFSPANLPSSPNAKTRAETFSKPTDWHAMR